MIYILHDFACQRTLLHSEYPHHYLFLLLSSAVKLQITDISVTHVYEIPKVKGKVHPRAGHKGPEGGAEV
jgi:hypothetical protein